MHQTKILACLFLCLSSVFSDVSQAQHHQQDGGVMGAIKHGLPLVLADIKAFNDGDPMQETAIPSQAKDEISRLKTACNYTIALLSPLINTTIPHQMETLTWFQSRIEARPVEAIRLMSAFGSLNSMVMDLIFPSENDQSAMAHSRRHGDDLLQDVTMIEKEHFWWDILTPVGDGEMNAEINPTLPSTYTAYAFSYAMGWYMMTQLIGRLVMVDFSNPNSYQSQQSLLRLNFCAMVLTIAQYIYGMSALSMASESICRRPRLTINVMIGHMFLLVLGLLDPNVPPEQVNAVKEFKMKNDPTIEPSEIQVLKPWDDIRMATQDKSRNTLLNFIVLAWHKTLAAMALFAIAAHSVSVTGYCLWYHFKK